MKTSFLFPVALMALLTFSLPSSTVDAQGQPMPQALNAIDVTVQTIIESSIFFNCVTDISMAVGDLTNDGNMDLVVTKGAEGCGAGAAVFQRLGGVWDGGTLLSGPSLNSAFNPIIAPIRNDGKNWLVYSEHLWGNSGEWLRAYRYSGTAMIENKDITARFGWPGWFAPAVGDLNGDGNLEVWIVTLQGSPTHRLRRHVWDPTSNSYPGVEIKDGGENFEPVLRPLTGDFIGNGTQSLIWAAQSKRLELVYYTPGSGTYGHTSQLIFNPPSSIIGFTAGNYDGIVGPDIAVATWNGSSSSIYVIAGGTFNAVPIASDIPDFVDSIQMGDLDGNGYAEVYAAGRGGRIYSYDPVQGLQLLTIQSGVSWLDASVARWADATRDEVLFTGILGGRTFRAVSLSADESVNNPPTADADGPYSMEEGSSITLNASASSDPENNITSYEWDLDNDGQYDDATGVTTNVTFADDGTYIVGLRVTDDGSLSATDSTTVSVFNAAPIVEVIAAPMALTEVYTTINASVNFTDIGVLDTHTAVWEWGDNNTSLGVVDEVNGSGLVTGSHVYTSAGVYLVKVTVTDDDGGSNQSNIYIVIYNPNGGFVTGGGWITSPAGVYTPDLTLSGKATFGFASKYQKGANVPNGNTEFQFKAASLNFKSTSYDWLVVAGTKSQYKGTGTINGTGEYGFMLTATDGMPDKFRIKIWDKITGDLIYDNMLGEAEDVIPATTLGGGSIVIHK